MPSNEFFTQLVEDAKYWSEKEAKDQNIHRRLEV